MTAYGKPCLIEICAVRIHTPLPRSEFERLFAFMSPEKQYRCKRFLRVQDSERLLVADTLVRHWLCRTCQCANETLRFDANEYGKPFLTNNVNAHFNVAHSGNWVTAAFDQTNIGIDVQTIKPIDMALAERFFTKQEYQDLMALDKPDRRNRFFDLWVLKESYIKAVGQGLSLGLDSISFNIAGNRISYETVDRRHDFFFRQYDIDPDCKLAVCAKHDSFPDDVTHIRVEDIDPGFGL